MAAPSTEALSVSALHPLRCQETLSPLLSDDEGLYSPATGQRYPQRDNLIFGGYNAANAERINMTMAEERDWQASLTPEALARDQTFLARSVDVAADLVRIAQRFGHDVDSRKCLEVGAGSGWVSWLFAHGGYDPWLCDFEANSLALGWVFDHPRMGPGKRIVCDATVLPFADGFFDLVICKEFAHHIEDKVALFAEANRVIAPGGYLLLAEPCTSISSLLYHLRQPDPHEGHVITWAGSYIRALRKNGFETVVAGNYSVRRGRRFPFVPRWEVRETDAVRNGTAKMLPTTWLLNHLFGGQLVLIARKTREARRIRRPPIRPIPPSTLTVTPADRSVYGQLRPLVEAAAGRVQGVT